MSSSVSCFIIWLVFVANIRGSPIGFLGVGIWLKAEIRDFEGNGGRDSGL